jgi:hypothetical protein
MENYETEAGQASQRVEVPLSIPTNVDSRTYLTGWLKNIIQDERNYILRTGKYRGNQELEDRAVVEVNKLLTKI